MNATEKVQIITARAYVFNPNQAGVNEIVKFQLPEGVNPQGSFSLIAMQRDGEDEFSVAKYSGRYPTFPVYYVDDVCNATVQVAYIAPDYPFQPEPAPQMAVVPDFLADNRAELEALRAANEKLEADLASAKEIIVQAGAMVEKKSRSLLDAIEANVQLKRVMDEIYVLSLDEIFEDTEASEKYLNNQLDKINRIALDCRSKSASEESSDAAQAVTLDNIQVLWLADHIKGDNVFETWMKSEECYKLLDAKIITEVIPKVKAPYWIFRIVAEYDTEANRQAIEARRTTLAQS